MSAPSNYVAQNGQGVISADNLNTLVQVALNYNALRSFTALSNMVAFALGTSTANDGGQALFYYSAASTATDNNSTVLVPFGAVQGAWLRVGTLA